MGGFIPFQMIWAFQFSILSYYSLHPLYILPYSIWYSHLGPDQVWYCLTLVNIYKLVFQDNTVIIPKNYMRGIVEQIEKFITVTISWYYLIAKLTSVTFLQKLVYSERDVWLKTAFTTYNAYVASYRSREGIHPFKVRLNDFKNIECAKWGGNIWYGRPFLGRAFYGLPYLFR